MRAVHTTLQQRLERTLRSPQYQRMIQEPLVTTRNGRYCIPVRSEFRTEFRGIIHAASASGAFFRSIQKSAIRHCR